MDYFCLPGSFPCLPTDFRFFRAPVPGLFKRLCLVFHRAFLLLPFVLRTNPRPFPLFCFALRFPLSSDRLPFVPRTSSRPFPAALFVLRCGFLCLPTDFRLFRALVPGLFKRLWLDLRTSSRPFPAALFVLRCGFLLSSNLLFFVPCTSSRPSPTGSFLFCAAISIVFTPTFFCFPRYSFFLVRHFVSLCRSHSFVLIARWPLLSTFSKQ